MATNTGNFDNPLILAIETSGRLGSVALAQGDKLLSESCFSGQMRHSAEIFPAITGLLSGFNKKPEQIEQVYISAGPGSFTGLRIAVTFAKTLALANNSKIVAVNTLDCIAANVNTQDKAEQLGVILDAKRGQFFIAVYEKTQDAIWHKILPDCLMTAEEFIDCFTNRPTCGERSRTISLTGEGLVFYKDKFAHKNICVLDEKFWNPSAVNVHKLGWELAKNGQFADPLTLIPNYIRGPDVTVKRI
ncbi:MAG: tRNA (adenosine(37)-N6)-threonylcarbamoyltransferase complex dimerization subunit type 1 TsaB [Sedimentisphaerales bacterium]